MLSVYLLFPVTFVLGQPTYLLSSQTNGKVTEAFACEQLKCAQGSECQVIVDGDVILPQCICQYGTTGTRCKKEVKKNISYVFYANGTCIMTVLAFLSVYITFSGKRILMSQQKTRFVDDKEMRSLDAAEMMILDRKRRRTTPTEETITQPKTEDGPYP